MFARLPYILLLFLLNAYLCSAQQKYGAVIPWTTYEAEHMHTNGAVLSPRFDPHLVETESSGQQAVILRTKEQFVEFTAGAPANAIVIRYSLPDDKEGKGRNAVLDIYVNDVVMQHCAITSCYAWLYGKYPFTNDPGAGNPRHFYDEVRVKGLGIKKGDIVRVQRGDTAKDNADYCIIDLADLEMVPPALDAPPQSLSVKDKMFGGNDSTPDYTAVFQKCIAKAAATGKTVWIPAGTYVITGNILLPENVNIQGAGIWYTVLVGDEHLYTNADRRIRLIGNGSNIHLADFSITGALNYRSDREANDGIVGSFGKNSTISNIWIEHTKVGMWVENSMNLTITGCRMRNTMADGINFCVGMTQSVIENCTARGTGDDGFAIWPAVFGKQLFTPGHNLISHCTAQLPYLANGAAIYGGESNAIKGCSFTDITQGSAILISTTFPTENKSIHNNFSGTTTVQSCRVTTSGGFDHEWGWRGAVEICLDKRNISGLAIGDVTIDQSLSNAISIVAKNEKDAVGVLQHTALNKVHVSTYGIGTKASHSLFISDGAHGSIKVQGSRLPDMPQRTMNFTIVQ